MPFSTNGHAQNTAPAATPEPSAVAYSGFATRAIRVGQDPCRATGATIVPVYQTATFTQASVGVTKGYDYSRSGNPTREALERQLAALEDVRFGVAFASGMAAVASVAALLRSGDHIVANLGIYGGTHRLFTAVLPRYGITATFADLRDPQALRGALRPETRLVWIETPSNPLLDLVDIAAIARLRRPGQILAVDNTFATPFFQRPIALGADVVVHSTTKYASGHSDVVGGFVATDDPAVHEALAFHQNAVGAIPGPWDAYLTLRGAKTLALRMREHERNAIAVAEWLSRRRDIAQVWYPGLTSHPQHALARRQMHGFGGIVSLRVRGGGSRALAVARRTRVFNLATSLGGVESLICSPPTMTHASVPADEKRALGITDDLLRLSVGVEDVADLLADLDQALDVTGDGRVPSHEERSVLSPG
jgi:cystathionine beta-lyase/cystathionine gamma-synthase